MNRSVDLATRIRLGEGSTLELKQVALAGASVKSPSRADIADEFATFGDTT